MTPEELLYRLGELAADFLARPDNYEAKRRLEQAVEAYDLWRWDRAVVRGALDALAGV